MLIEYRKGLLKKGATDEQITKLALFDAGLTFAPDWVEDNVPWYIRIDSEHYWKNDDNQRYLHFSTAQEAVDAYITYQLKKC